MDELQAENERLKTQDAHVNGLNKVMVNNAQKHLNENERLIELLKLAYRNWLEDPDVAWVELGEKLCDGLCESMGDKDYQEWMQALKGNQ